MDGAAVVGVEAAAGRALRHTRPLRPAHPRHIPAQGRPGQKVAAVRLALDLGPGQAGQAGQEHRSLRLTRCPLQEVGAGMRMISVGDGSG